MPSSCVYLILFFFLMSVPVVSHCGSGIGWIFLLSTCLFPPSVILFFLFITQLWEKKHNCTLVQRCLQRWTVIQTASSCFPTAVVCTVWFLKQDKISQYQKIENAFELQRIYIARYSVRLILVSLWLHKDLMWYILAKLVIIRLV